MAPLAVRSLAPLPTREQVVRRCAQLSQQRADLAPDGPAYEAKSLELDNALSALFLLGPKNPWEGDPS